MQRHSITTTTYPLKRITTRALRHIALSPLRIAALIEKFRGTEIYADSLRFLSPRLTEEEKKRFGIRNAGSVQYFVLASGGRFLATLSTDFTNWHSSSLLSIWDLGITGIGKPVPLARILAFADMQLRLFFQDPEVTSTFFVVSVIKSSTS